MALSFFKDQNDVEIIEGIEYDFPYTMHERDLTHFSVPWHWHEEVEFNYVHRGTIDIQTLSETYTIRQGQAYFINSNVMDSKMCHPHAERAVEHAHLFHPIILAGYYRSRFEQKYLNPILKNQHIEVLIIDEKTPSGREFLNILHQLTNLQGQENQEFIIRNLLSQAWLALMAEVELQKTQLAHTKSPTTDRVRDMIHYLHQHYAEKVELADLARTIGYSERECIRAFKQAIHQTPIDYLVTYRIEQAKQLLAQSEQQSITEIALDCGFTNSNYFTRIFKKQTGLTPKNYREQVKD